MTADIVPFRSEDRALSLRCRRAAAMARLRRVLATFQPAARGAASRAGANAGEGGRSLPVPLPRRGSIIELGPDGAA